LIRLKKENQALWNGEHGGNIKFFDIKNDNVLAFVREKNGNRVIVIMNLSDKEVNIEIPFNDYSGKYINFTDKTKTSLKKNNKLNLQKWDYKIFVQNI
ncbi:MAG: alpha-glucosidase C-terminal domain-containing protein, partial [Clostridiales bacterium]|nr:alpha-glucosidase C-terminal domain-containing protein [Clostridiales bacterium]